jgi:cell wall-associated NlpC family hydrolase
MIERMQQPAAPSAPGDYEQLAEKANRRRATGSSAFPARQLASLGATSLPQAIQKFPTRYLTHTLVALTLPAAIALGTLPLTQRQAAPVALEQARPADFLAPAPLALSAEQHHGEHGGLVGDAPLAESDAMPVPLSLQQRSEALAPLMVPASISGDSVNMRGGPGTAYDSLGKIGADTAIRVLGRSGDWLKAQRTDDQKTFWISAELVTIAPAAAALLSEISDFPPPPPPKVARVIEDSLNLRDGPGTNYLGITKMSSGQDLTLLQRYVNGAEDWFNVIYGEDEGWVSAQYLVFNPGVAERIPITTELPDPNPPLIGVINDNQVNLRKGPASAYERVGQIDADIQVDLLGRYKDWAKIQTADGTKAWVFKDLVNVSQRVWRRVPVTENFPALPRAVQVARSNGGGGGGGGASVALPSPSGDVAGFAAQFIGYPYVWGGTGPYGFDCSGLMVYTYSAYGVRLPRTAAAQYYNTNGVRISDMGSLAPGDLVFFVGTAGPGISHVAMYIGGGQIVHAMTPAYGVQVSNLYSSYWMNHYYGAVRPLR